MGSILRNSWALLLGMLFLIGAILAMLYGMMPVFGTAKGLTVTQISILVGLMYLGALPLQYPIGWISGRMDRRRLMIYMTTSGAVGTLVGFPFLHDVYAIYRATCRVSTAAIETSHYATVLPQASHIALGVAQELAIDQANSAENGAEDS
jgi:MFS family permease